MFSIKDAIKVLTGTVMKVAEFMNIMSAVPNIAVEDNKITVQFYKDCEIHIANGDDTVKDKAVPQEVQTELKRSIKEVLRQQVSPVYVDGIALMCDMLWFSEEQQEDIKQLFMSTNEGGNWECEDEDEMKCFEFVKEFVNKYHTGDINEGEADLIVEADAIYLNCPVADGDNFTPFYEDDTSCKENDVRQLAKAVNCLFGERYITGFVIY